jgi:hypothetical protein
LTRVSKEHILVTATFYNYWSNIMFESIEIRKVTNGFIVILNTEEEANEYVFDTSRKAIRFIKEYVEAKAAVAV